MSIILKKLELSRFNLKKAAEKYDIGNQKANVILCLDISGSMKTMLSNGTVQRLLERILPMAMEFDSNGELDLYFFSDNAIKCGTITVDNIDNFVKQKVLNRYDHGGTEYAKGINLIVNDILETKIDLREKIVTTTEKKGFFDKLFGRDGDIKQDIKYTYFNKTKEVHPNYKEALFGKNELPYYVIFVTDGENTDYNETIESIKRASHLPIFFKFVGIGEQSNFQFLEKLDDLKGRFIDNADFYNSVDMLANKNDVDEVKLYNDLLEEFPEWLKECYSKIMIYYS